MRKKGLQVIRWGKIIGLASAVVLLFLPALIEEAVFRPNRLVELWGNALHNLFGQFKKEA